MARLTTREYLVRSLHIAILVAANNADTLGSAECVTMTKAWRIRILADSRCDHCTNVSIACKCRHNKVIKANPEKQNNLQKRNSQTAWCWCCSSIVMFLFFWFALRSFGLRCRTALKHIHCVHSLHTYIGAAMPCAHNYMIRKLIRFNIFGATIFFSTF